MKDIAQKLWTVRRSLVNARYDKAQRTTDVATSEAELALAVEGKNAEERKAKLVLLLAADANHQEALNALAKATHHLEGLEAEEAYLLDLRRAQEWHVRLQMAAALSGKSIASDGNDADAQDALDDAQIDAAFTSPSRPTEGSSHWRLPRDPQAWQMPSAELPASLPHGAHRNAPVLITDDEVPF